MARFKELITTTLAFLLSFSGRSLAAQDKSPSCPEPTAASDSKFHPGQVWRCNTREHGKGLTLTILKVESLPELGVILHI
jgi:hypothetical protein